MRLSPLEQFVCDNCGEIINSPEDGWLEWISEQQNDLRGFINRGYRIVHHKSASPNKEYGGDCYYPREFAKSDMHLDYFLGPDGLTHLLEISLRTQKDPQEVIEIIRRLHIPHYEEARIFFHQALEDGIVDTKNKEYLSQQAVLKKLIETYNLK